MRTVFRPGDPCPKCATPMVERGGMFYFRGLSCKGIVCVPCNALWEHADDPFMSQVSAKVKAETGAET